MPPAIGKKVFNIPYPGGAAIVAALINYSRYGVTEEQKAGIVTQYSADGTTVVFPYSAGMYQSISVNDGVMTVTLTPDPGNSIIDCRCCLIPGDPFA